ncbi:Permease of the drug/metabolite transporter (DMT) superfamily [Marinobacterium lacunae]|uniref:Permease of the drug/metabolite transporter (DMT) superfamily n=1 Tax=Marinobacterium lacunae TaxID=1232683 RepID=A0A081G3D2_9GAMM|nr:DMT family transporter [Marinobacterium lacunae]KEA65287.1 Permease of the drug/metabolite transporter (DMT) superfamily [Marinobacterium lacunae]
MAYLFLTLTILFWAGNLVTASAIHMEVEPVMLAFQRWVLVLVLILPWALPRIWRQRQVILAHLPILIVLSILSVANFNTFLFIGLQDTTASNAALMQSAIPIVILVLSALLLREPTTPRQWVGVFISIAGVAVLITRANLDMLLNLSFNRGDIWVGAAVLTWSLYSIALRWRPTQLDGFTLFAVNVLIGVLLLSPVAMTSGGSAITVDWSPSVVAVVAYMAVFPSILAYLFWNRGVAELGAAKAGLFIHLMPLFGVVLSVLFLGDTLHLYHAVGMGLIFTGIYLATLSQTIGKLQPKRT